MRVVPAPEGGASPGGASISLRAIGHNGGMSELADPGPRTGLARTSRRLGPAVSRGPGIAAVKAHDAMSLAVSWIVDARAVLRRLIRPSLALILAFLPRPSAAQDDELVVRPGPPAKEDFETDADGDGVPDGWYNFRDAKLARGGVVGPTCLRFENQRAGRQARASRAFGVDGKKTEALIVGLWVRLEGVRGGERMGEDPGLAIDLLGNELRPEGNRSLGPWTGAIPPDRWVRVAKRLAVPEGSLDGILSIGLMGATGILEVDGLTIEEVPRGGGESTNLLLNGGLELGDPDPAHWQATDGARRGFPGRESDSALELAKSGARGQVATAAPLGRFTQVEVRIWARGAGLRGGGGAVGELYFVDEDGRVLPGAGGSVPLFRWSGSFDWREFRAPVRVPVGAARAVLQFEKTDGIGSLKLDDAEVAASPDPSRGAWSPYRVATDAEGWRPYEPAGSIAAGSALDFSFLLEAPAGGRGSVGVKEGHLAFEKGGRARFFGVAALPPLAIPEPERADAMADDLARRGVNLVRFDALDAPYGPGRSLIDDKADDTITLDPAMLERFDHLVAALKKRGISITLELVSARRFRAGDSVPGGAGLPVGGGPATAFDPKIREVAIAYAKALLGHVNPETGLALKDDPALAWVTISGEQSLFDLLDDPGALPPESAAVLRGSGVSGRRGWQSAESGQWRAIAEELRRWGLRVPIGGCAHWRREPDFAAAQAIKELDLIDDRLYWGPPHFAGSERRSMLWHAEGTLPGEASKKRRADRPYVVSQWAAHTDGLWALPYEGADVLLAAEQAGAGGWDALVRRGLFQFPEAWGAAAPGTSGGRDLFPVAEAINANPAAFAMLPHAASIYLRGQADDGPGRERGRARSARATWDPSSGRLAIETPHTVALAGTSGRRPASTGAIAIEHDEPFAAVAVSSAGREPLATARRLLVTAVGRVEPTGLTHADAFRTEPADAGRPPLRVEPVRARVTWKRRGNIKAYLLDNAGNRIGPATLESTADGVRLVIDGRTPTLHRELVEEAGDGQAGGDR